MRESWGVAMECGAKMYLTVGGTKYECRGPMSTTKAIVRHLLNSPRLHCRFSPLLFHSLSPALPLSRLHPCSSFTLTFRVARTRTRARSLANLRQRPCKTLSMNFITTAFVYYLIALVLPAPAYCTFRLTL